MIWSTRVEGPKLFLMENVPGIQSARREDMSFLEAVARRLEREGGYRTFPYMPAAYSRMSGEWYGRSPAMKTSCGFVRSNGDRSTR